MTTTARDLEAFWAAFTANRQFKSHPRLLARAEGMHYWTDDGRKVLDGVAGLWCVNAGHGRKEITEAVSKQLATMEYAPPFQMGHPSIFGPVVHALGACEQARLRLELTVGRERHPECFEIGARGGWHGGNPGNGERGE